jgi:5-methylcytosine-specific restriction endonuclease McrBC regulatory subunit McrC
LGETTIPLPWSDPVHRSLGHLVPDAIIRRPDSIQIIDAKYKAHFADLDATRWHQFTEEMQAAHRADIHQILAYAAAYGDVPMVQATLVYPVPQRLATVLADRGQDRSTATIPVGQRTITLDFRALPFGPIEAPFRDG